MNSGRYQVLREAGKGSMGVVYEAQDPQIGRVVALKVLRQDRAGSDDLVKRFLREAKAIGRLSHPHIVTIYDAGEDAGSVYIAMEFVPGKPLKEVIAEGRLTIEETIDIGVQVAETLHYAHEKGVVHRDIKPSNLILQPDGRIKITDFGIARIEDSTATLQTQAGEMMGTPAYMSPEQVQGKPVDRRTDVFSLGIVLYELATGRRPFGGAGATLASIFHEIVFVTPPAPAAAVGSVPPGLSRIIVKCLDKSAQDRYQTGKELAEALGAERRKLEEEAARSAGPAAQVGRRPAARSPVFLWSAVAAGALASGLGIYRYSRRVQEPAPAAVAERAPPPAREESPPPSVPPVVESRPTPAARPPEPSATPGQRRPPAPSRQASDSRGTAEKPGQTPLATPLKVVSTPEGATISIDGRAVGRSPGIFMVSVGRHRIRAAHPGFRDADAEVEVHETMEFPIRLFLEPAE